MEEIIRTKWATGIKKNGEIKIVGTSCLYSYANRGYSLLGGLVGCLAGNIVGEGIEYVPYMNELFPYVIQEVSDINISGNINGFLGLLGFLYGTIKSGCVIDKNTLKGEANILSK